MEDCLRFCTEQECREEVKEENPNATNKEINVILIESWEDSVRAEQNDMDG